MPRHRLLSVSEGLAAAKLFVAAGLVLALAPPVLAGDGSGANNPDLTAGGPGGAMPLATGERLPESPGLPFFDIDWTLALRGTLTHDADGERFAVIGVPEMTAARQGVAGSFALSAGAEILGLEEDLIRLGAGNIGIDGDYRIDRDTVVSGSAALAFSQSSASDPGIADTVAVPPLELWGQADISLARRFGRLGLTLRGGARRDTFGETLLNDTTTIDNTERNRTGYSGGLRASYELTPVISVFVDGGSERDVFDAPSSALAVKLDSWTHTGRGGISGDWRGVFSGEVAVGLSARDFDDASLTDDATYVFDAELAFNPDETLSLRALLASGYTPPNAGSGAPAEINRSISASADVKVNALWSVNAAVGYSWAEELGSPDLTTELSAGIGAVLRLGARTSMTADYEFVRTEVVPDPAEDTHIFSLGLRFSR